jgi:pimeloyl-ACP methyl ester carboxylesterase
MSALERLRSRGWLWRALVLVVVVGIVFGVARALSSVGADIITVAPNRGMPRPTALPDELLIDVGPPPATLSVTLRSPEAPHGTVFVLHGIRANKENVAAWGEMLVQAGYRAVLVDLRGHGRSTGDYLTYGATESSDMMQVLNALEQRHFRVGKVGVLGVSYGAATAIQWAAKDSRIAGVVAVAPFASLRAVVPGYVPVKLPSSFVNACVDRAGERGGFDPDDASPAAAAAKTRAPLLLVHGRDDMRIPYWHSELIAASAAGPHEVLIVPGEDHDSITADRTHTIATRVPAWFDQALGS